MSIAALAWVFKQKIRPSSVKFVLVAIADCANDTGRCWPSAAHLCEVTSHDRKTVLGAIAILEKRGYLADTGDRKGRTKQVRVFQMLTPKRPVSGTVRRETVPFFPGNGTVFPTKGSQKRDTEPSWNRKEPLSESRREKLEGLIRSHTRLGNIAKANKYRTELESLGEEA